MSLLLSAFESTKDVSKKLWKPNPPYDPGDASHVREITCLAKSIVKKGLKCEQNEKQIFVLRHLLFWRDAIARREDESPAYVCPNDILAQFAQYLPPVRCMKLRNFIVKLSCVRMQRVQAK